VRPAPERDRPTEGCQLAVLTAWGTLTTSRTNVKEERRERETSRKTVA
jgi:hypothetical protein